ncbi:hypothetical protein F1654_04225 [Alkalicaulis satelles]|uniref:DUF6460 domain-containing protein n=1 Tax=Alkalicaulis satelles TaxID=2609175 RepID=A0A5M6ZPM8_9PROT|nr:DUF6460 domain-containing protein [Alkalicaulis satelles]KAA5805198.1 hypothetical protein F1654_04225 [Alkalicaulis satelles]
MSQTPDTLPPPARRTFLQRLVAFKPSDIVLLVVLCVVVGLVLAAFRIDPAELWVDFFGAVARAWSAFFESIGSTLRWAVQYLLLGAVIVVPIWIVVRVITAASRR